MFYQRIHMGHYNDMFFKKSQYWVCILLKKSVFAKNHHPSNTKVVGWLLIGNYLETNYLLHKLNSKFILENECYAFYLKMTISDKSTHSL